MSRAERLVIYSGLALAVAAGLGWRGFDRAAEATPWAASQPAAVKIASIDVFVPLDAMIKSEAYTATRNGLQAEWQQRVQQRYDQARELEQQVQTARQQAQQRLAALPPGDPQASIIQSDLRTQEELFQGAVQRFQQAEQEANQAILSLQASQIREAYLAVQETAHRVAGEEGYTYVFATREVEGNMDRGTPQGMMEEILARPLLLSPDGVDITDKVLAALNLSRTDATGAAADEETGILEEPVDTPDGG